MSFSSKTTKYELKKKGNFHFNINQNTQLNISSFCLPSNIVSITSVMHYFISLCHRCDKNPACSLIWWFQCIYLCCSYLWILRKCLFKIPMLHLIMPFQTGNLHHSFSWHIVTPLVDWCNDSWVFCWCWHCEWKGVCRETPPVCYTIGRWENTWWIWIDLAKTRKAKSLLPLRCQVSGCCLGWRKNECKFELQIITVHLS